MQYLGKVAKRGSLTPGVSAYLLSLSYTTPSDSGHTHLSAYDVGRRSFPFFLQIMILRISAPALHPSYSSPEPRISHNGRREV